MCQKDPSAGIDLDGASASLQIHIPGEGKAANAVQTDDGTVVYGHAAANTSVAIQVGNEGTTRFLTVIDGPKAPSNFRFPIDLPADGKLQRVDDGSIAILDGSGDGVATIAAPWAFDANRNAIPASFAIDGKTLVLHVDHHGAAYPVAADPAVRFDCGWVTCSAYISRSATHAIGDRLSRYAGAIGGVFGVACIATGVGSVAAAACTAIGATYGSFAVDQFVYARNTNQCIRLRYSRLGNGFPNGPYAIYVDNSKYCSNS